MILYKNRTIASSVQLKRIIYQRFTFQPTKTNRFFFKSLSSLVYIEHKGDLIIPASLSAVTSAFRISKDNKVDALLIGSSINKEIIKKLKSTSPQKLSKIIIVDNENLKNVIAQPYSKLLNQIAKENNYDYIIGSHSSIIKDVLFRAASLLDSQPVSDVIKIENENTFIRPIYAGNAVAKLQISDKVKVFSIRGSSFDPIKIENENDDVKVENYEIKDTSILKSNTEFVEEKISKSDRPELSAAPRIVSGGRGLKSGENFELLYKLADKLNAAVGASRAAVDAGYVDNSLQVGQTGKIVAPELYVAVGISGAIQHLAGMKDSKTIVAINKDPDAPIFQVADYGLVGDLFKVVPELTDKLS